MLRIIVKINRWTIFVLYLMVINLKKNKSIELDKNWGIELINKLSVIIIIGLTLIFSNEKKRIVGLNNK